MTVPRIQNVSEDEHCRFCCSSPGLVFVGTELWQGADYDQVGPCPACELGQKLEFPPKFAQWGPRGFWQGRPWDALQVTCNCGEKLPSGGGGLPDFVVEALARMRRAVQLDDGDEEAQKPRRESSLVDAEVAKLDPAGEGKCDDCKADVRFRVRIGKVTVCRVHAVSRIKARFVGDLSRPSSERIDAPKPAAKVSEQTIDDGGSLLDAPSPAEEVGSLL
jgi:hypothetical protein